MQPGIRYRGTWHKEDTPGRIHDNACVQVNLQTNSVAPKLSHPAVKQRGRVHRQGYHNGHQQHQVRRQRASVGRRRSSTFRVVSILRLASVCSAAPVDGEQDPQNAREEAQRPNRIIDEVLPPEITDESDVSDKYIRAG